MKSNCKDKEHRTRGGWFNETYKLARTKHPYSHDSISEGNCRLDAKSTFCGKFARVVHGESRSMSRRFQRTLFNLSKQFIAILPFKYKGNKAPLSNSLQTFFRHSHSIELPGTRSLSNISCSLNIIRLHSADDMQT